MTVPSSVDKLYYVSLPRICPKLKTLHRRACAVVKDPKATLAERKAAVLVADACEVMSVAQRDAYKLSRLKSARGPRPDLN